MSTPEHGSQRIGGASGTDDGLPVDSTVIRPADHNTRTTGVEHDTRTTGSEHTTDQHATRTTAPEPVRTTRTEETTRTATQLPPATHSPERVTEQARPRPAETGHEMRPARAAKTSAAAVFGLVFGLAALFCALTALLAPAAVVFGIIGLILAFVGLKMAKRVGITGRGVAIGGLITSLLGLILGGVIIGGLTAVVNDKSQLDRVQKYVDDARAKLPSTEQVRDKVTNP